MADELRVMLEIGPKGKQVVAVAPDWPGLERGAKTEEAAIARVQAYLPRYAPVAKLAGMGAEFAASVPRHRRRGRALSGHRLNRLLGHLVRVLGYRQASHVERSIGT